MPKRSDQKKSDQKKTKTTSKDPKRPRKAEKSLRRLERRLEDLDREQRRAAKRLKRLARQVERTRTAPAPPGFAPGRGGGRPPWATPVGPLVSLEVPLETEDPAAPLWATVSARLPEEITAVGDDGQVVRYRYSAVGSTPQAPRYRLLGESGTDSPEPFPG